MKRNLHQVVLTLLCLCLTTVLHADTITLRGTTIAVPVTIERISAGRVFYQDHTGRSVYRPLDEIEHIHFADLPQLETASTALARDQYAQALPHLMHALLAAQTKPQRLWVHMQLVRTHDLLGEYIQACSHFAAIVQLEEHVYWRNIAPMSSLNEPAFAAAEEAILSLRRAQQSVTQAQLAPVIAQMIQNIEPVRQRLAARYTGPPIEIDSTISGIPIATILSEQQGEDAGEADDAPPVVQPIVQPVSPPQQMSEQPAANSIERLLAAEQWQEAIAACERAARSASKREQATLLHQYGLALHGAGRPEDAAIAFTRCAILHSESSQATLSLIETAMIYRDVYDRHETAARLLARAEALESKHNRPAVHERIAQIRQSLRNE